MSVTGRSLRDRLTLPRVLHLPRAVLALLTARLSVARQSDLEIMRALQVETIGRSTYRLTPEDRAWLADFSWALCGVAKRVPFRANCLIRVLAARRVLERRGWPVSIGVQAGQSHGAFTGHAWLLCDGADVTGGPVPGLATLIDPEGAPPCAAAE